MEISFVSSEDGVVRLRASGKICPMLPNPGPDPVEQAIGEGGYAQTVLVDLEQTEFIDSAGIGWLLGRHRRFREQGGILVLHTIPPMVAQVLHLMRLGNVLHLADHEAGALALTKGARE